MKTTNRNINMSIEQRLAYAEIERFLTQYKESEEFKIEYSRCVSGLNEILENNQVNEEDYSKILKYYNSIGFIRDIAKNHGNKKYIALMENYDKANKNLNKSITII